jgi:hypothetical protein
MKPATLSLLFIPTLLVRAGTPIAPLHPGDAFPEIAGEALSGKPIVLPAVAAPQAAVVAFSFSRAGGNDSQKWIDRLSREFPPGRAPETYVVIMLESVPALFRGMALSGIKSGMPAALQSRTLVSYQDEELWKKRLLVTSTSKSYVVLLDARGLIRWTGSNGLNDADYERLKDELASLPPAPR